MFSQRPFSVNRGNKGVRSMAATVMELYGSKVFNEHEMRERLPSSTYKSLKATIEKGQPLDLEVANVVASVMKRLPLTVTVPVSLLVRSTVTVRWPLLPIRFSRLSVTPSSV